MRMNKVEDCLAQNLYFAIWTYHCIRQLERIRSYSSTVGGAVVIDELVTRVYFEMFEYTSCKMYGQSLGYMNMCTAYDFCVPYLSMYDVHDVHVPLKRVITCLLYIRRLNRSQDTCTVRIPFVCLHVPYTITILHECTEHD